MSKGSTLFLFRISEVLHKFNFPMDKRLVLKLWLLLPLSFWGCTPGKVATQPKPPFSVLKATAEVQLGGAKPVGDKRPGITIYTLELDNVKPGGVVLLGATDSLGALTIEPADLVNAQLPEGTPSSLRLFPKESGAQEPSSWLALRYTWKGSERTTRISVRRVKSNAQPLR